MAGILPPVWRYQFTDLDGDPLSLGSVESYLAGTMTPTPLFTDSALLIPFANPYTLPVGAKMTAWMNPALSYKLIVKDDTGAVVETVDDIQPLPALADVVSTVLVGTQNNFALNSAAATVYVRSNNASPVVITGIDDPFDGRRVVWQNIGTSTVRLADEDGGSDAANGIICGSVRGQIVGAGGVIDLVYDGTSARWRILQVEPGAPIDVAFNAANFTASAGVWTLTEPDQVAFAYRQNGGSTVSVWFTLNATTVSAAPNLLFVAIPGGFTAARTVIQMGRAQDNGPERLGLFFVSGGATQISCQPINMATAATVAWSTATNGTTVQANFEFEVL